MRNAVPSGRSRPKLGVGGIKGLSAFTPVIQAPKSKLHSQDLGEERTSTCTQEAGRVHSSLTGPCFWGVLRLRGLCLQTGALPALRPLQLGLGLRPGMESCDRCAYCQWEPAVAQGYPFGKEGCFLNLSHLDVTRVLSQACCGFCWKHTLCALPWLERSAPLLPHICLTSSPSLTFTGFDGLFGGICQLLSDPLGGLRQF